MSDDDLTFSVEGLDRFIKALKRSDAPRASIGILGGDTRAARPGETGAKSNAEIGAYHEYGTTRVPMRSFLRMPLATRLAPALEAAAALDEDVLKEVLRTKSIRPWLSKVAILGLAVVQEAFDTGGFGEWAPLAPSTWERKEVNQILVETQQLRRAVTWEVS